MSDRSPLTEPLTQPMGTRERETEKLLNEPMHIDEFLAMPGVAMEQEMHYPHFMFSHWRKDAMEKMLHSHYMRNFKLFAEYQLDDGTWLSFRVVGASRMGDVWLTPDFESDNYTRRVDLVLARFRNWRDEADRMLNWGEQVWLAQKFFGLHINGDNPFKRCNANARKLMELGVPASYMGMQSEHLTALLRKIRRREE